jgi:hypothetical protein
MVNSELSVPDWVPASVAQEARRIYVGARADNVRIEEDRSFARLVADERMRVVWSRLEQSGIPAAFLSAVFRNVVLALGSRTTTAAERAGWQREAWDMAKKLHRDAGRLEEIGLLADAAIRRAAARSYVDQMELLAASPDDELLVDRQRTAPDLRGFVIEVSALIRRLSCAPLRNVVAIIANVAFGLDGEVALDQRRVVDMIRQPTCRVRQVAETRL